MDFGTITKKLKNLNYRSKKEFADDLNLIYDNCLIYNTNPASEYRKHANAMRRKTDRLMSRVPDIVIKERIETEIEEEGDEVSDEDDGEPRRVSKKVSDNLLQRVSVCY
jgi:transcriptional activator SPT7